MVIELDQLRGELATGLLTRQSDRATARQSLQRAQDLDAELFRARDLLKMTLLDVEEARARALDLEAQVGVRGVQREQLLKELAERSSQLSQAMALHEHDSMRWHAELERVRQAFEDNLTRWHAEQERARQAYQHELSDTSRRLQQERDLAVTAAQRDAALLDDELSLAKQSHADALEHLTQRMRRELDQVRGHAQTNANVLVDVLSSRSWRLTWPLRIILERARGKRWVEPVPQLPASAAHPSGHEPVDG